MRARLKNSVCPDGLDVEVGKWYDVEDVKYKKEKGKYGEIEEIQIKNRHKQLKWYKAKYFVLYAETFAYLNQPAAQEASQPLLQPLTRNTLEAEKQKEIALRLSHMFEPAQFDLKLEYANTKFLEEQEKMWKEGMLKCTT